MKSAGKIKAFMQKTQKSSKFNSTFQKFPGKDPLSAAVKKYE